MRRQDIQAFEGGVYIAERIPGLGITRALGVAAPTASAVGYCPGCTWQNVSLACNAATAWYINVGTLAAATWQVFALAGVAGVAAGYKIARGVTALDGSNPTPVTTGLATVVAATVSLEGTAAPGVGTSVLTIASTNYATGALAVYAWKVTGTTDTTLVASTGTENFEWIALGTG